MKLQLYNYIYNSYLYCLLYKKNYWFVEFWNWTDFDIFSISDRTEQNKKQPNQHAHNKTRNQYAPILHTLTHDVNMHGHTTNQPQTQHTHTTNTPDKKRNSDSVAPGNDQLIDFSLMDDDAPTTTTAVAATAALNFNNNNNNHHQNTTNLLIGGVIGVGGSGGDDSLNLVNATNESHEQKEVSLL